VRLFFVSSSQFERFDPMATLKISHEQWLAEAERRYGASLRKIRVVCPACGHIQSGEDFLKYMTPDKAIQVFAFSCIGRFNGSATRGAFEKGQGPCDYTNGGLITLGPICVEFEEGKERLTFDFADEPLLTTFKQPESATV